MVDRRTWRNSGKTQTVLSRSCSVGSSMADWVGRADGVMVRGSKRRSTSAGFPGASRQLLSPILIEV